ncbi:11077_t:CDS:2 [Diversispora eburnea]|uniref:11077_t:CDS:1 n=1 Tax=Diversispora eburnea TaxID=1213867 RepID=A0A9N8YX79_9GLOM|nr:11077_t:CDS:2 [Diversispora eburnea]
MSEEVDSDLCYNLTYFKDVMKGYRKIDDNIMLRMNTTNTHSVENCTQFFKELAEAYSKREKIINHYQGLERKQKALDEDPYDSNLKNQMFVDESKLIEIPVTATIEEAFDVLLAENILSVPVYRYWRNRKQYIAIVNVFDLVAFVCLQPIFNKENEKNEENKENNNSFDRESIFLQKPIGELIGLTCEKRPTAIDDDESKPCFVSQTDVVRFLFQYNHILGKSLDTLASDVANKATLTAFKKIHQVGVSAVAVVNDDGSLVGEVSAADLRGLNSDRLSDLKKPVIAFLTSCKGDLIKPLTCHGKFTLSQVMSGIIHSKTHRAWVVDEDDIPIGVITLSDILTISVSLAGSRPSSKKWSQWDAEIAIMCRILKKS